MGNLLSDKREIQFSIQDIMQVAEAKTEIPGWIAYEWQAMEGGSIVVGCVPDGVYTRGPRKGTPRLDTKGCTHRIAMVVALSEMEDRAHKYEAESGRCWNCKGEGKVWSSWSAESGTRFRSCDRCGATGKAPETESAA